MKFFIRGKLAGSLDRKTKTGKPFKLHQIMSETPKGIIVTNMVKDYKNEEIKPGSNVEAEVLVKVFKGSKGDPMLEIVAMSSLNGGGSAGKAAGAKI